MNISKKITETRIILLMCLVQLLDILEFMVVMPLGPDFAFSLGIDQAYLGYNAASYTLAAAISGIMSAKYIDRFERKSALLFGISGLVIANFLSFNASFFAEIIIARFISGIFGGITTALTFSIIADLVPPDRRGYVIGKVMSAFSIAATIGVPICLKISQICGWQQAFLFICILGISILILVWKFLPNIDFHLIHKEKVKSIKLYHFLKSKKYMWACITSAVGYMAMFMIIPYVSAFLQLNLEFDRSNLSLFYFIGGVFSFFTVQLIGKYVDTRGSIIITLIGVIFFSIFVMEIFILESRHYYLFYILFMSGIAMRNVANSSLMTKISSDHDRAGFMSVLSMFQHVFSALGCFFASNIIKQDFLHAPLQNMNVNGIIAIILFFVTIPLMAKIKL